jgi:predicted transglutaminase-like cysteine proteinase
MKFRMLLAVAAFSLLQVGSAYSFPLVNIPRKAPAGTQVAAPFGFIELCMRDSRVCKPAKARQVSTTETGAVLAKEQRFQELETVNRAVNRAIRPRPDRKINGVADRWQIGASEGDCEEYALEKRQRLIDLGWPSSALQIAIGRIGTGEQHAVLLVRTQTGVYVLDNLRSTILPFNKAPIRWIAAQAHDDPGRWRAL